jgi:endonuclease YncB( thermonuclease family)
MKPAPYIALVFVLWGMVATADQPKVISVYDGDTLKVVQNGQQTTVRLQGIDAPEIGQPFGTKSRDHLAALAKGKMVTVHEHGHDKYGRTLGRIEIEGEDVNQTMVADGMAWHFRRFDKSAELAAAEEKARDAKRGLWADKASVPPWEWRAGEHDRKAVPAGR